MIEDQQSYIAPILTLLICIGIAAAVGFWRLSRRREYPRDKAVLVKLAARNFHQRVAHFTSQVRTLDEHANEYTSIFNSDDWGKLVETVSSLEQLDLKAQALLKAKRYGELGDLLRKFYSEKGSDIFKVQSSLESCHASADWELNVHAMLKRVVHNLEAATYETRELTRSVTSRKRQPTLVTLADVKKILLEEEVFRRSVERGPD